MVHVHDVDRQNPNAAHLCHAVLLDKIKPNFYELVNSYPNDPKIRIPKNRKTFNQDFIRGRAADFGNHVTGVDIENLFSQHSNENIEWNVNKWVLRDEGYSLQFRLK